MQPQPTPDDAVLAWAEAQVANAPEMTEERARRIAELIRKSA